MLKIAVVHISGPKMSADYRFMLENRPGGIEKFQNELTERTTNQLAELNTLITDGWQKWDSEKFAFQDGEAIVYVLYKPDPLQYVVERASLDTPHAWESVDGLLHDCYQDAWNVAYDPSRDKAYTYRVRSVNHA